MPFYVLASEITLCHFFSILLGTQISWIQCEMGIYKGEQHWVHLGYWLPHVL